MRVAIGVTLIALHEGWDFVTLIVPHEGDESTTRMQGGGIMDAMWIRCGSDADAMWTRCGRDVDDGTPILMRGYGRSHSAQRQAGGVNF